MRSTDIRIREAAATFQDVSLDHPLRLSGATVDRFTLALVTVTAEDRAGRLAEGTGSSVLSVPWAWPRSAATWEARDTALRDLTRRLAETVTDLGPADPFDLYADLASAPGEMPDLAVALARGAVDNAVHDAWARAAGRSAWSMYAPEHTGSARRDRLPVQHVVGVGDPLDDEGPGRSLRDWVRSEGIAHLKVKVAGADPDDDAKRVAEVYDLLRRTAPGRVSLSVDPNEGYREAAGVVAMLDALRVDAPAAYAAVAYLEQPVPRDAEPDPRGMREIGRRVPVLVDEGLAGVRDLADLVENGWSGLVVKAAKGQTLALTAFAHARAHGLRVMVQDLTAVDLALAHSARLAAALSPSWPAFEYNSRQYAPKANARLAEGRPDLVAVRDGHVIVGPPLAGIY